MEKKTPLYEKHVQAGGNIVPFAGYLLPVNYQAGIIAEHNAVRTAAGLFDVSHMAELTLKGADALANINKLVTNDCAGMADGRIRYSPMCYEDGGTVDDLLVYKRQENDYLLVVNAGNHQQDRAWFAEHLTGDVRMEDISENIAQIALQGPASMAIIQKLVDPAMIPGKYYTFTDNAVVAGKTCILSRTGYTGEDGFEIYCSAADGPAMWDALMKTGAPLGLIPCGLGCRDTLRLEAAMPLYGHELSPTLTPAEAGLGTFIKFQKPDFIGKAALEAAGKPRTRIGLKIVDRAIAREGFKVFADGIEIGFVTSGTQSPTLGFPIAMAMVPTAMAASLTQVAIDVRGRKIKAQVIPLPFYKKGQQ
jgi:aminomethyltransferase